MDPLSLLMIVAAAAAFYFLIIRPGKQRQRQQAALMAALQPGAEVMTTAGIFGTVAAVADDQVSVEVAPGVHLRLLPAAIAKVVEPAPTADTPAQAQPDAEPPVD